MSTETISREVTKIPAKKVKPGMTVIVDGDNTGEWTVLSHHPVNATWWLHRWFFGEYQTTYAHYRNFQQVIWS